MEGPIVVETDPRRVRRQRLAVEFHPGHSAAYATWIFDRDVVARGVVLETHLESLPRLRDARLDDQRFVAQTKSQYPLEARPIHPAGRAGIPGPSAAPDMRR